MNLKSISFDEKFELFNDLWSPKCVAQFDNYLVKVAKIQGHFTWHSHSEFDEVFLVHKGDMRIDFRDAAVELKKGEMYVVPKGEEHKPYSENECEIILIENKGVSKTGDDRDEFTKERLHWI
jgi:mannose-6-phosphate isomerase-like protein (cupin superfamily)